MTLNEKVNQFVDLALIGQYPLFYDEWLRTTYNKRLTFRDANKNVKDTFKVIGKHRQISRMKESLFLLDEQQRVEFVHSFLKVVEHQYKKNIKTLH